MISHSAQQNSALVGDLAEQNGADQVCGVFGRAVLRPAEEHIARDRAFNTRLEPAVPGKENDRNPRARACANERRRNMDGAEHHNGRKHMKWQACLFCTPHLRDEVLAIKAAGKALKEAQEEMARQKQQMAKKMSLVRESLIASEGVLPSDKEVTAVLEAIEKGKKSLSPGKQ